MWSYSHKAGLPRFKFTLSVHVGEIKVWGLNTISANKRRVNSLLLYYPNLRPLLEEGLCVQIAAWPLSQSFALIYIAYS